MAQQHAQPPAGQPQQQPLHAGPAAAPMLSEPLRSALERLDAAAGDGGGMGPLGLCALGKYVSRELQHRLMALFVFGARLNQLLTAQKVGQIRSIAADCGCMLDGLGRICRRLDALKAGESARAARARPLRLSAACHFYNGPPVFGPMFKYAVAMPDDPSAAGSTEELYFSLVAAAEAGDYSSLPLDESIRARCRQLAAERDSLAADVSRLRAELAARAQRVRTADWQAAALLDQLRAFGNADR